VSFRILVALLPVCLELEGFADAKSAPAPAAAADKAALARSLMKHNGIGVSPETPAANLKAALE